MSSLLSLSLPSCVDDGVAVVVVVAVFVVVIVVFVVVVVFRVVRLV